MLTYDHLIDDGRYTFSVTADGAVTNLFKLQERKWSSSSSRSDLPLPVCREAEERLHSFSRIGKRATIMPMFVVNTNVAKSDVPAALLSEATEELAKAMGKPAQVGRGANMLHVHHLLSVSPLSLCK